MDATNSKFDHIYYLRAPLIKEMLVHVALIAS